VRKETIVSDKRDLLKETIVSDKRDLLKETIVSDKRDLLKETQNPLDRGLLRIETNGSTVVFGGANLTEILDSLSVPRSLCVYSARCAL
jgi:hypothetical protein